MRLSMKHLLIVAVCFILALTPVFGQSEQKTWDCPECGRTGNTGAFCGNCGYPAPQPGEEEPAGTSSESIFEPIVSADSVSTGDSILFGRYEQDNDWTNGQEPIEWTVKQKSGNKLLLLSRFVLDNTPVNQGTANVTWESSDLRRWLNESFFQTAFTAEEQKIIQTSEIANDQSQGNPAWKTNGGNNTQDSVFILSYYEATTYFSGNPDRRCTPTIYAMHPNEKEGTEPFCEELTEDGGITCGWWLRSPGEKQNLSMFIGHDGSAVNHARTDAVSGGVRPAIWIDLGDETATASAQIGISRERAEINPMLKAMNADDLHTEQNTKFKPGDYLSFGHYEQDNNFSNGPESIEWRVLKAEGNTALIISKNILDNTCYNEENADVIWQTSTMRRWLNRDFYADAFSEAEKEAIRYTVCLNWNEGNPSWKTSSKNNTFDRIFLLSYQEAATLFDNDADRKASPTAYAVSRGTEVFNAEQTKEGEPTCGWWVRSPGKKQNEAMFVSHKGQPINATRVSATTGGVRPAMWVDLSMFE